MLFNHAFQPLFSTMLFNHAPQPCSSTMLPSQSTILLNHAPQPVNHPSQPCSSTMLLNHPNMSECFQIMFFYFTLDICDPLHDVFEILEVGCNGGIEVTARSIPERCCDRKLTKQLSKVQKGIWRSM